METFVVFWWHAVSNDLCILGLKIDGVLLY